jgi:ABC-type amino acid transport substrate-binding protein
MAMLKSIAFLLLVLVYPFTAQGSDKALERIVANGEMNCGVYVLGTIFSYDKDGKPKGFTVDLMREVGARLDVKIKYTEISSFATLRQDMDTGKFDMVCAPTLFFFSTAMKFLPSKYIAQDQINVYADGQKDISALKDVQDLNDPRYIFVGMDGELGGLYVPTQFPKAKLTMLPQGSSPGQMFLELQTKKADFLLLTRVAAQAFLKENPGKIKLVGKISDLRPSLRLFYPADSYQLKANVDAALDELEHDGRLAALLKKHDLLF